MLMDTPTKKKPGKEATQTPQRRQLVLNFIHEYRRLRRVSPTFEEIALGIGYTASAAGTAHTHVRALIEEGWLEQVQPGSRSILPLKPPEAIYCLITDPDLKQVERRQWNLRILRRL